MAVKSTKKKDCCTDALNLPEEMEEALRQKGGLERLKDLVPNKTELASEAERFQAVSDPIRLQILHAHDVIYLCPCLLKEITELTDSGLSYHLNILEEAKLIASSPRKRWRVYVLTEQGKKLIGS
jgi:DNA-binding transcriptional ArsR family regulator